MKSCDYVYSHNSVIMGPFTASESKKTIKEKVNKLRREGLDLHRLLALVHNSCCYATMQHLMTSFLQHLMTSF